MPTVRGNSIKRRPQALREEGQGKGGTKAFLLPLARLLFRVFEIGALATPLAGPLKSRDSL